MEPRLTPRRPHDRAAPETSSRDKILDVAEALFAQRGFSGVGLREVADAVGLGKSSLFHHFRSKVDLYLEVLGRVLARIDERVQPVQAAALPPFDKLDRWIEALVDVLAEQPATARLLLRGLFEDDAIPADAGPEAAAAERRIESLIHGVGSILREGIEQGVFRTVSVAHTIQTLIGATVYHFASGEFGEGLIGSALLSGEEVRRRKDHLKALLHHGLAA